MRDGVFWITKRIAVGQFASPKRAEVLARQGITHVLNVGECPSVLTCEQGGFKQLLDLPIKDFELISKDEALNALDSIHAMILQEQSRVYVHCIAGQNRSPTILWLYFIACGMSPNDAKKIITDRSPDAIPGHQRLVDNRLTELVVAHGADSFLPLPDESILKPAY